MSTVDVDAPTRFARTRAAVAWLRRHRRLLLALQALAILVVLALCALAVESEWTKAEPRLEDADLTDVGLALVAVAAYYLVFILGWIRMLDAWGIRIGYRVALQAEMVSMLAKYVPGGVWTPAARAVALRRNAGVTDTPTVLASILVEAGLSAISGVIVFVVSLAWEPGVNAPLPLLLAFALLLGALLHPRIFRPVSERVLKPFGAHGVEPLPFRVTLELLVFYCGTWVLGGLGLYFLLRGVGANPGLTSVAFLGGTSAIGAIVAVVVVFVPSGLGVREGAMYAFLAAIVPSSAAVDATILNRLVITAVELALFGAGVVGWRSRRTHDEVVGTEA